MRNFSLPKMPCAVRVAVPLAAVAVFAAACSGSGTTSPAANSSVSTLPGTPTPATTPAGSSSSSGAGSAAGVTVQTHSGPDGTYLTDAAGRTLYLWTADTGMTSMCTGTCATAWPPLTSSGMPSAGSGVTASELGLSKRADGTEQVTYNGHPLYYFIKDTAPGQMSGQGLKGFGAPWWMVSPAGTAITMSAGSASSAAPSPTQNGSTGSGGGSSWS